MSNATEDGGLTGNEDPIVAHHFHDVLSTGGAGRGDA